MASKHKKSKLCGLIFVGLIGALLTVLQPAWADDNQAFIATIQKIGNQNIIVKVDDGLVSGRAPGQVVSLLITEKTIFKDSTLKVMTLKAFISKAFANISLVEVQSTTLPGGVVRADIIVMLAGR